MTSIFDFYHQNFAKKLDYITFYPNGYLLCPSIPTAQRRTPPSLRLMFSRNNNLKILESLTRDLDYDHALIAAITKYCQNDVLRLATIVADFEYDYYMAENRIICFVETIQSCDFVDGRAFEAAFQTYCQYLMARLQVLNRDISYAQPLVTRCQLYLYQNEIFVRR